MLKDKNNFPIIINKMNFHLSFMSKFMGMFLNAIFNKIIASQPTKVTTCMQ